MTVNESASRTVTLFSESLCKSTGSNVCWIEEGLRPASDLKITQIRYLGMHMKKITRLSETQHFFEALNLALYLQRNRFVAPSAVSSNFVHGHSTKCSFFTKTLREVLAGVFSFKPTIPH